MLERFDGKEEKQSLNAFTNVFPTYLRMRHENRLPPSEFVEKYRSSIRLGFNKSIEDGAIPVLICAWNETEDLPKLLRALSLSTDPVKPIVIDNNSTDGTGKLAKDLGAEVIVEKEQGLMCALITGFRYLAEKGNVQEFLLTDADSYPTPTWAVSMKKSGMQIDSQSGGMIMGQMIYHGKLIRDTARNISGWTGDLIYLIHRSVGAKGGNGFIKFGTNGAIAHNLANELNPNIVVNTDAYVRDNVRSVGGILRKNLFPGSWVFSRGDRYPSFLSLFKSPPYGNGQQELYSEWIKKKPDGVIYKSPYYPW